MSKSKEEVKKVHENTDFKVNFAGVTKPLEFEYSHGSRVPAGLDYHIHYTNSKREVYMLHGAHTDDTKIIEKISGDESIFSQYSSIKSSTRKKYPKKTTILPTESEYRIGTVTRYFAQKVNNPFSDIFEVSDEDFEDQNNLFRYIEFEWRLTGTKEEVIRDNLRTINTISRPRGNEGLRKKLYPLQFWKPSPNSVEDFNRRLGRLKTTFEIYVQGEAGEEVPPQWGDPDWVNPNDFIHRDESDDDFVRPDPYADQVPPWDKYESGP